MLLKEFSTIFDRPEKVKKLREYILSLAVRGKLVEQDENDEPASVLLERIREEKDRLIKEKKIKKEKPLPEISEEEIPYELPKGWEIAYFQDITSCITCGLASTPRYVEQGKMFLSAKNVKPYRFMPEDHKFISEEDFIKLTKNSKPEINDILLTRVGAGIGEATIIDQELEFAIYVSLTLIKPIHIGIDSKYMLHFLNSPDGVSKSIGNTFGKGVSQGNLNVNQVRKFIMPIPPLNEQKKIVEKVDYLMEFCDKLEEQLDKQVKYGSLSAKSVLNGVSNCSSYEELEEALRFIIENFKDLTLADGAVGELKNTILSLAVKGKLVPQDDSDEPAGVLIEKIKAEKDRLIKEKVIKKEKYNSEIDINEELPIGWSFIKIGDVSSVVTKQTGFDYSKYIKPNLEHIKKDDNIPMIQTKNFTGYIFNTNTDYYISEEIAKKFPKILLHKKCMLLSIVGASIGNLGVYTLNKICFLGGAICKVDLLDDRFYDFIYYFMKSTRGQSEIKKNYKATAQGTITVQDVREIIVPLPPLNEQKRIVEKVDKLMKVCDELELRIEESKKYNEKLMESILKESFKV